MNFYKRFIGDIQAKTGGLTLAEFGAYDRLLDHYYSTEVPVPADEVYRICRAMSAPERTAVDKVLAKFFDLTPTGWAQSKADEQIAKALPLIEAARANGKKGGRPKKPKTQSEPSGLSKETQSEPSSKAIQSQSQISPSDEGEKTARKTRNAAPQLLSVDQLVSEGVERQHAEDWLAVRAKKTLPLTRTAWDEVKTEAGKAGMSPAEAVHMAASNTWGSFKAKWLAEQSARSPRSPSSPHKHAAAARAIWGDPNQPDYIDAETH